MFMALSEQIPDVVNNLDLFFAFAPVVYIKGAINYKSL